MSSFICDRCGILNIDSDNGFIEGCRHHLPEKNGRYEVKFTNLNDSEVSSYHRSFMDGAFYEVEGDGQLVKWIKENKND